MKKIILLSFLLLVCISACGSAKTPQVELMPLVEEQMAFGPRTPGSAAHDAFVTWAARIFSDAGWQVSSEKKSFRGKDIQNVIAERNNTGEAGCWILLGAHYDSRLQASEETLPEKRLQPVPGANDGASGVAVLLKLAQTLPETPGKRVTFVLFDAEDQGNLPGWPDWCLGSAQLAEEYAAASRQPDQVIVLDMIGDRDLNVYREKNSDPQLTDALFSLAQRLGLSDQFPNEELFAMYDDHIPFLQKGIPAADLIDFTYADWHKLSDTADKLSEESLQAVYRLMYTYLTE